MKIKKPKFDKNPLCDLPGLVAVWRYVPPGSGLWEPIAYLLVFQNGNAELFDLRAAIGTEPFASPQERQKVISCWFNICTDRNQPELEHLRLAFTHVVCPSSRLTELIEAVNTWECFDGGGIDGEPYFENDTQRSTAAEINSMIQREFFG